MGNLNQFIVFIHFFLCSETVCFYIKKLKSCFTETLLKYFTLRIKTPLIVFFLFLSSATAKVFATILLNTKTQS